MMSNRFLKVVIVTILFSSTVLVPHISMINTSFSSSALSTFENEYKEKHVAEVDQPLLSAADSTLLKNPVRIPLLRAEEQQQQSKTTKSQEKQKKQHKKEKTMKKRLITDNNHNNRNHTTYNYEDDDNNHNHNHNDSTTQLNSPHLPPRLDPHPPHVPRFGFDYSGTTCYERRDGIINNNNNQKYATQRQTTQMQMQTQNKNHTNNNNNNNQNQNQNQNRTFLHIQTSLEGGFPETQFTHYIQTAIIDKLNTAPMNKPCDFAHFSVAQTHAQQRQGTDKEIINSTKIETDAEDTSISASTSSTVTITSMNNETDRFGKSIEILLCRIFSSSCRRNLPEAVAVTRATVKNNDSSSNRGITNVTFGFRSGDYSLPSFHKYQCFAFSSKAGIFSVFNFKAMLAMSSSNNNNNKHEKFSVSPYNLGHRFPFAPRPWEERENILIWRGTLWDARSHVKRAYTYQPPPAETLNNTSYIDEIGLLGNNNNNSNDSDPRILPLEELQKQQQQQAIDRFFEPSVQPYRIPLTGFSLKHPDLLNARSSTKPKERWFGKILSSKQGRQQYALPFPRASGLQNVNVEKDLFPSNSIKEHDYYQNYQVAVVMGGIGAAYRLCDHLAMGSAVILQNFTYEEWFTPYMTPFVNYIPLANNLSNLKERLVWVKENPNKVKEIASQGQLFWERYLSFEKMEEFYYELIYRMAEAKIYKGISLNIPSPPY